MSQNFDDYGGESEDISEFEESKAAQARAGEDL